MQRGKSTLSHCKTHGHKVPWESFYHSRCTLYRASFTLHVPSRGAAWPQAEAPVPVMLHRLWERPFGWPMSILTFRGQWVHQSCYGPYLSLKAHIEYCQHILNLLYNILVLLWSKHFVFDHCADYKQLEAALFFHTVALHAVAPWCTISVDCLWLTFSSQSIVPRASLFIKCNIISCSPVSQQPFDVKLTL